ncbi:MAG: DUF952 domain-containing protein [Bdellovibrionales bacterium]
MKQIFHITEVQTWTSQASSEDYLPTAYPKEGFIHTSNKDQVLGVYDRYYSKSPNLILLVIDGSRLTSELREEPSSHGLFPHIYGPINKDAIIAALNFSTKKQLQKILKNY